VQLLDLKAAHERYGSEIEQRMQAVLLHGHFIMGPEVAELEQALAGYVGVAHCVSVGSGTQALEVSLRALGIGPGDEVITTPFSWISSAEAIALVGASVAFADIEPVGFGLDPIALERAIGPRTRAILAVSLYGQMPDYTAINELAAAHGLSVIEDGAQSFGATQRGKRSGSMTRIGCTSFFPSKPLGCYGDGGALFTDDAELAQAARAIRQHGRTDRLVHGRLGTNARLDTLQAAVLLAKLAHLEPELATRRQVAARYDAALGSRASVPRLLSHNTHVYAQYTLRVAHRDRVARALAERGVPTAVHYARCLHQQPIFAEARRSGTLREAERAAREVLSLPLHPYLSEADQAQVLDALDHCLARRR
jgi:UDP-2-acetamido-2-deoxy-ribo-hexuluronate aminotransferase